jgi:hypothetical protein
VFEIEAGDVPGDVLEGDHGVVNVTFKCPECTSYSPLSIHDEPDDVVRYSDLKSAYGRVLQ